MPCFRRNFPDQKIISIFISIFVPKLYSMEQKNLNRLRVIIAEKNLTNKWISEQLGVGQATVSKWVQNNAQPNLEMLIKISKLLKIDINELIRPDEVRIDQKALFKNNAVHNGDRQVAQITFNDDIINIVAGMHEEKTEFVQTYFANPDFQNFVNARVFQATVSQLSSQRI